MLAVAAAFAEGDTEVRGAGELRVKESDRIATVTAMLRALGATVQPTDERVRGARRPPALGSHRQRR